MSEVRCWINGHPGSRLDVSDRAVHYGDGLFETLRIRDAEPEYLDLHLQRLQAGCERLGLPAPDWPALRLELQEYAAGQDQGVLKLILSRGRGGRGYRPPADAAVTRIISLHPLPDYGADAVRVRICRTRLARQPLLAGIKHLNRLEQVLARAEWDDDAIAEGLMLDSDDHLVEAVSSNLFLVCDGRPVTPDLSACGVAGVMRSVILDLAREQGMEPQVRTIAPQELRTATELFICNSLTGIRPVTGVDAVGDYPVGPVTRRLQQALQQDTRTDRHNWQQT